MKRILVEEEVFERFQKESQADDDASITLSRLMDLTTQQKPRSPHSYPIESLVGWKGEVETK
jgi:hypothetical protein